MEKDIAKTMSLRCLSIDEALSWQWIATFLEFEKDTNPTRRATETDMQRRAFRRRCVVCRIQDPIFEVLMTLPERLMDFLDDPDEMSPDERLHELAAILAAACMHLLPPHETPLFSPLPDKELDVSLGSTPPLENGNGLTHREPWRRMQ